jgi:hypothetical protein
VHNVLTHHNVAKHCKFDARGTVVPTNTVTSAPTIESRWLLLQVQSVLLYVWFEKT